MNNKKLFASCLFLSSVFFACAQESDVERSKKTEVWSPVPKMVTPAKKPGAPPSDAIILFNGKNLDQWVSKNDTTKSAQWIVDKDVLTVKKGTGNIRTKQNFMDYQLHIEWRIPKNITGSSQARGNSGVFLGAWGNGEHGYEVQVLDSYKNETYVNGQAGSIYKQSIPSSNPTLPPGEWNAYDIAWTAPRFNDNGSLKSPGMVTVFFNGVLVQNNVIVKGETKWIGEPAYQKHGALPIMLQDHGDPSPAISFRNIWIRPL
jgi:hypothetical protein